MFTPKYFQSRYWTPKYWAPSGSMDNVRFVQLADLTGVRVLGPMPQRVNYVMVQAEVKNVRYRMDGGAPTASMGLILYAGDPPTMLAGAIQLAKFIEVTGAGSAKLNVRYY